MKLSWGVQFRTTLLIHRKDVPLKSYSEIERMYLSIAVLETGRAARRRPAAVAEASAGKSLDGTRNTITTTVFTSKYEKAADPTKLSTVSTETDRIATPTKFAE